MELQRRGLSSSGKKEVLMERLGQALLDEGHDPDEYEFRIEDEVSQNLKSINEKIESSSQRMKEEMRNMIESSNQGMKEEMKNMNEKIDSSNQGMKEEIKSINKGMKEEMRNMNEKIESSNQGMKEEMKNMIESSNQGMKEEMKNMIESSNQGMKEEMRNMNEKLESSSQGMKEEMRNMNEKMKSVNQAVEDMRNEMKGEINEVKSQIDADIKDMKEEVDKIKEMNQRHDKEMEAMKEQLHKVQVLRLNSQTSDGIGKMKPPIFDGLVSWSVYKRQFEAAARINNWTRDEEKATALVLALRGKASELLQTIPDQRDYGAIVKAIELRYGDEHMQEVFRVQLKTRQQKPGESLQELEADIERLAHLSYPSATQEILDVIATDAFIDAIRDPELKQAIRISGKRKTSEALVYALSYESAKDASRNKHHVRNLNVDEDDLPQQIRRVVKEVMDERRPRATNQTLNRDGRTLRCWNCNSPGHLRRQCMKPIQGQAQGFMHQPGAASLQGRFSNQEN